MSEKWPPDPAKRRIWMQACKLSNEEMGNYGKKGRPHWRERREEIYRELLAKEIDYGSIIVTTTRDKP